MNTLYADKTVFRYSLRIKVLFKGPRSLDTKTVPEKTVPVTCIRSARYSLFRYSLCIRMLQKGSVSPRYSLFQAQSMLRYHERV